MIPTCRALCALLLVATLGRGIAFADGARFAVVVGSNRGEADAPSLRYAERDATRVGEVLVHLGGVAPEHLLVVRTPSRIDLEVALAGFAPRLAAAGPGAVLFFYYSGHADSGGLLLSGTRLPFGELKRSLRGLGAATTVLVLDACRSAGAITAKGGTPTTPFRFDDGVPDVTGLAIVTSSSANEDSQESERLRGGVFTHQLVTGLRGAADASGDGRVGLSEAYRYAYAQTLVVTAGSEIEQHPTFAFDLRGQDDLVVTRLDLGAAVGQLELNGEGRWLIFERFAERRLVAEVDGDAFRLALPPGPYLVRRTSGSSAAERTVLIGPGATVAIAPVDLALVPFRHAVRKGYGQAERAAWSLGLAIDTSGPILEGGATLFGVALTAQLDLAELAFEARVRAIGGGASDRWVERTEWVVGLDLGLYHVFELGPHGLGFGLRLGVDWLAQRFADAGGASPVDQGVVRAGPFLRAEWAVGGSLALSLDVGFDAWLVELERDDGPSLGPHLAPTASLGFAFALR